MAAGVQERADSSGRKCAIAPVSKILIAFNADVTYERDMVLGALRFFKTKSPRWEFYPGKAVSSRSKLFSEAPPCDAILGHIYGSQELAACIRKRNVPTVLIEEYVITDFPTVIGDNPAIGKLGFEHLRSKGFRRFAFVGWSDSILFDDRREGFARAVRSAGLELMEPPWFDFNLSFEQDDQLPKWLAEVPKPIGVLAANSFIARHLALLCRTIGASVPEEVALLGVDHEQLECEASPIHISLIDHGMEQAGYEAAALIDRMLRGGNVPAEPLVVPPVGVIERQSTNTLAVDDPDIRSALTLIREHAFTGLTVKELLEMMPMARRKLEVAFRKHLGRGIHEEITRIRLERAKFLLRSTQMTMPQIAEACGFQYAARLNDLFAHYVGATPTAYRRGEPAA